MLDSAQHNLYWYRHYQEKYSAYEVISQITETMAPSEFEELCQDVNSVCTADTQYKIEDAAAVSESIGKAILVTALNEAVKKANYTLAKYLAQYPVLLHRNESMGLTPLGRAIYLNDITMVEILLNAGASPYFPSPYAQDFGLMAPLSMALRLHNVVILRSLLNHGCDPDQYSVYIRKPSTQNFVENPTVRNYVHLMGQFGEHWDQYYKIGCLQNFLLKDDQIKFVNKQIKALREENNKFTMMKVPFGPIYTGLKTAFFSAVTKLMQNTLIFLAAKNDSGSLLHGSNLPNELRNYILAIHVENLLEEKDVVDVESFHEGNENAPELENVTDPTLMPNSWKKLKKFVISKFKS